MSAIRDAVDVKEDTGIEVKRLMPVPGLESYDPFLRWEYFAIPPRAGLPPHSDHGFEAITYLLSGALRYEDSRGNRSTVTAGGAQRFNAGRGLTRSEMPVGDAVARGVRVWINLSSRLKGAAPDYRQVDKDAFPGKDIPGGHVITVVGEGSPLQPQTPMRFTDIRLDPGCTWRELVPDGYRGLVYVVSGSAAVLGRDVDGGQACLIENTKQIRLEAREESRLLACFAQPYGEPIV